MLTPGLESSETCESESCASPGFSKTKKKKENQSLLSHGEDEGVKSKHD